MDEAHVQWDARRARELGGEHVEVDVGQQIVELAGWEGPPVGEIRGQADADLRIERSRRVVVLGLLERCANHADHRVHDFVGC